MWGSHIGIVEDLSLLGCGIVLWASISQHFEGTEAFIFIV
jgi:hypothetical protein